MSIPVFIIPGGDLLASARSFNLIHCFAHGANCWSTMGSGIAGFIARDFPDIRQVDSEDPRSPEQRRGNFSYAFEKNTGVWGFNLYTQFYPGPHARMPYIISATQLMFEQVHDILEGDPDEAIVVGFPAIGCGIGGMDLVTVVRQIYAIAQGVYEETKRRVIPVFYIMEATRFAREIEQLSSLDQDIFVVDTEEEIIKMLQEQDA